MKLNRLTMAVILSIFLWGITTTNLMASSCTGFLTYTQGGWGADPHGNNPGVYLQNNFAAAFPNGLTIGCGSNTLVLTSSSAVNDFLPSGGTPSTLPAGTLTDPGQAYSNTFAGQLVAVTLNVVFDQYDSTFSSNSIHVADLIVQNGPFAGQTVSQVIAEANSIIGGCSTSYTVDDLNTALDDINSNYDNGTSDEGFLSCSSGCTLSLNGTSKNVTCYGSANGSIDVSVSGAQGLVSYLWNDGATTQDRSGLAPGKYWVTATDQGSCKASDTFNITQPDSIHLSSTHVNVSITGGSDGSIDLTVAGGTPPYSYLWNDGVTTQDRTGLAAGTYSVTVTDHNGCQDHTSITIMQPGCNLSMSGTPLNITCYGSANGSIDVSVSGAQGLVSYLWNDGVTTQDRSGLVPGKYWVTATDQGSCKASDTFNISQPDSIHLSSTHVNVSITGGSDGSIDLTVTGGTSPYTYLWNDGATTQDRTGLTAGTYSVTVTDHNGCQDHTSITIMQPGCNLSMSGTPLNVTCYGSANGSIDVSVSGAQGLVSYLWNDGATTQDRSGLAPGKYWVTATDQGSCKASDTFNISQPDSIHLSSTHVNVSITGGSDGSIDLTVTGGTPPYSYLWNDGVTTQDRTGLTAGTYSVTVTDHNGCQDHTSITITQPNCSLSLSGTTSNDKCYGSANGSIDVSVSGAQGSVSYLWNDGVTTQDRSGLAMGTYSVTATDQGGCSANKSFTISQPDSIHLSETHVNASSSTAHDGSITLTVTGGTPPYKYLWSNGKKTKNIKTLGVGTYTVVVTDANGCTATLTVVITTSTCACVPPTNITFGPPVKNKVQVCWNSVPCALGYIMKWKLSSQHLWQYRTVNSPDTCTTFTWKQGQTDLIYFASICSSGDTSAYSQLYTYPPPSRTENGVNTDPQFNVFPNPTSGHMMIALKNENFPDQQVTIEVVNIFGQIVLHDKSELVNGALTKSLELSDGLAAGMYMVNITIGNKILHQQIIYSGK